MNVSGTDTLTRGETREMLVKHLVETCGGDLAVSTKLVEQTAATLRLLQGICGGEVFRRKVLQLEEVVRLLREAGR